VKILGMETCELSQRMPAPPKMALSLEQIEVIRAWIAAGAPSSTTKPSDAGSGDGGATTSDAADEGGDSSDPRTDATDDVADDPTIDDVSIDAADATDDMASDALNDPIDSSSTDSDPCGDASPTQSVRAAQPSNLSQVNCTATKPCPLGMSCVGGGCDDIWECFAHLESRGEHPCPTDFAPYCGCDGVTFMALRTCPDRPYAREGACEDGVNCDPSALRCSGSEPMCPDGMVPSVVNGRYGPCVAYNICSCDSDAQCPHREKYTCDATSKRCRTLSVDP
jgi:hypothetical protein